MKYIVFWEFCPEDIDKEIKKYIEFNAEIAAHPDKYPKNIFSSRAQTE